MRKKAYRCELLLWGGNADYGSYCGLAFSHSINVWSASTSNIAARHTSTRCSGHKGDRSSIPILSNTESLGGWRIGIASWSKQSPLVRLSLRRVAAVLVGSSRKGRTVKMQAV